MYDDTAEPITRDVTTLANHDRTNCSSQTILLHVSVQVELTQVFVRCIQSLGKSLGKTGNIRLRRLVVLYFPGLTEHSFIIGLQLVQIIFCPVLLRRYTCSFITHSNRLAHRRSRSREDDLVALSYSESNGRTRISRTT